MSFSSDVFLVSSSDGRNFVLLDSITYTANDGTVIIIPKGAESDGASTPRGIWDIIPPFGTYWKAAYLHDYLYRCTQYPKEFCDNILLEAMEDLGVDIVERKAIYEGVALGGENSFDSDRKQQQKGITT